MLGVLVRHPPLALCFTQAHLCDTPFCNVSRDNCGISHKSKHARVLRYYHYKYRAIWNVSSLGLWVSVLLFSGEPRRTLTPTPLLSAPNKTKPTQIRTPSWKTPQRRTYSRRGVQIRVAELHEIIPKDALDVVALQSAAATNASVNTSLVAADFLLEEEEDSQDFLRISAKALQQSCKRSNSLVWISTKLPKTSTWPPLKTPSTKYFEKIEDPQKIWRIILNICPKKH